MTGEMCKADVTREDFPLHFAIADALQGTVEPFDVYQGPYIAAGGTRLFIGSKDGVLFYVHNEQTGQSSEFLGFDPDDAISAALEVFPT